MSIAYATHYAPRTTGTPQSEPIPGAVPNSAGGHAFPVDDWTRLDRFCVLGVEGATYYASQPKLTRENAAAVLRCVETDGPRAVARIVELSEAGRAPKNDSALFALALASAAKEVATRRLALDALPRVARTGTHLFHFLEFARGVRGWGPALRKAVAAWYDGKDADRLAYQLVKYRQRDGWTHRDLLRLAHPLNHDRAHRALYAWVTHPDRARPDGRIDAHARAAGGGDVISAVPHARAAEAIAYWEPELPALVRAFEKAKEATVPELVALVRDARLPWEALPTEALKEPAVWRALLPGMPLGALLRNLARMTANGTLAPLSRETADVAERLQDGAALRKARLHPLAILIAQRTYAQGKGDKGRLEWTPVDQIVAALEGAFHRAFEAVEPTGKRLLLALDVSGSMASGNVAGSPLTPREAAAALALVAARTEPAHHIIGFTASRDAGGWSTGRRSPPPAGYRPYPGLDGISPLPISAGDTLRSAVQKTAALDFGRTDCALPMLYAMERGLEVDAFVIYTDSETYAGSPHPIEALRMYRSRSGIPAKLVTVGLVSNGFSIGDPNDGGCLDVVGFDTAAPALIGDFVRS